MYLFQDDQAYKHLGVEEEEGDGHHRSSTSI